MFPGIATSPKTTLHQAQAPFSISLTHQSISKAVSNGENSGQDQDRASGSKGMWDMGLGPSLGSCAYQGFLPSYKGCHAGQGLIVWSREIAPWTVSPTSHNPREPCTYNRIILNSKAVSRRSQQHIPGSSSPYHPAAALPRVVAFVACAVGAITEVTTS